MRENLCLVLRLTHFHGHMVTTSTFLSFTHRTVCLAQREHVFVFRSLVYTTSQNLFFLFFWPVFFVFFFGRLAQSCITSSWRHNLFDVSEALRHFLPSSSFRLTNGSDETRSPSGCKRSCSFYGCCPLLPTRVSNQRIFLFYFTGLLRVRWISHVRLCLNM